MDVTPVNILTENVCVFVAKENHTHTHTHTHTHRATCVQNREPIADDKQRDMLCEMRVSNMRPSDKKGIPYVT